LEKPFDQSKFLQEELALAMMLMSPIKLYLHFLLARLLVHKEVFLVMAIIGSSVDVVKVVK